VVASQVEYVSITVMSGRVWSGHGSPHLPQSGAMADASNVRHDTIVVPETMSPPQVRALAEELFAEMGYFPDGLPTIVAETGEVRADVVAGRENPDQLIVNSNIGMAVCDVVGKAIDGRALAQNAGTILGL
jgi:ornithine cyclodeaminase/alanine dehydrogenase-like protein (mu-crystallin family)